MESKSEIEKLRKQIIHYESLRIKDNNQNPTQNQISKKDSFAEAKKKSKQHFSYNREKRKVTQKKNIASNKMIKDPVKKRRKNTLKSPINRREQNKNFIEGMQEDLSDISDLNSNNSFVAQNIKKKQKKKRKTNKIVETILQSFVHKKERDESKILKIDQKNYKYDNNKYYLSYLKEIKKKRELVNQEVKDGKIQNTYEDDLQEIVF